MLSRFAVGMAEPTRGVGSGLAVALEAESVVGPFQADHFESFGFGFGGVAGEAAEVAGRLLVMAAGTVLHLPVQLVDEGRGRHGFIVTGGARLGLAEGLVMAAGALARGLDVKRVVEVDGLVEVRQPADRHPVRDRRLCAGRRQWQRDDQQDRSHSSTGFHESPPSRLAAGTLIGGRRQGNR